jgi:hypothetical protein
MQDWSCRVLFNRTWAALIVAGILWMQNAAAEKIWNWKYTGHNIAASGVFTTSETADSQGFYQISKISGHRNGELITGMHPTGSAIPGNEPYTLDNLIRIDAQGQITMHGFGFSTVSGNYANPFFADFLATPGYMEVFTTTSTYSELPIQFSATPMVEPDIDIEPSAGKMGR